MIIKAFKHDRRINVPCFMFFYPGTWDYILFGVDGLGKLSLEIRVNRWQWDYINTRSIIAIELGVLFIQWLKA